MSWIWNPDGDAPKPPPGDNMVQDPSDPNRRVTKKPANQPFLAHKQYREKQEQEHQAWLRRNHEREEKLARGEEVGPAEVDPTAEQEVGVLGLLKFIVYSLLVIVIAGKFFTGSFLWEYDGKWARLKTYWPEHSGRLFSETYLATFDGRDPAKPLYLAVDGDVFDVSSNSRTYGPGGPYHHMVGVDAARSFGTGCFATHRTHDLRGLTDNELRGVQHWKKFFAEHKTYHKVGKVLHHPIDPSSPIPEHCDPKKEQTSHPATGNSNPISHSKGNSESPIREEL
ncbi:cytochrome b5-like heme/steroid binding domain-containing protein [Suillus occidentalis]|nr:cytochrome b5-like heme/steroid binding domain-containing protein [Suillus occidentalis]